MARPDRRESVVTCGKSRRRPVERIRKVNGPMLVVKCRADTDSLWNLRNEGCVYIVLIRQTRTTQQSVFCVTAGGDILLTDEVLLLIHKNLLDHMTRRIVRVFV